MSPEGLVRAWQKRVSAGIEPIPSIEVKDGPIFENVKRGADVDMTIFPAPKWHEDDGGRYIGTGSFDITRDPDNGWVNLGCYRVMVHDRNKLGFYISPGKHGRRPGAACLARGERWRMRSLPVGDRLLFLAAAPEVQLGPPESAWAGG